MDSIFKTRARRLTNRSPASRGGSAGFTLIETLVTFVILAIVLAVALPSYATALRKGNRADVKAIMMETAQFMERYYTTNKTYVGAAVLSAVSPKASTGTAVKYNITFSVTPTATAYTLSAAPANGQTSDSCGTLTLTNTGAQTAATSNCW